MLCKLEQLNEKELPMGADAFGGVLINENGETLLREPKNRFGHYAWTFAKGTPEPDETPEQTAFREVRQETGYDGQIIARIPGVYQSRSGATRNVLFLMRPIGPQARFDNETNQVRWVSFDEAIGLINKTFDEERHEGGRNRDLAILAAAKQLALTLGLLKS